MEGKDADEREAAALAKGALKHLIFGKIVELSNVKTDKYGRLLADVHSNGLYLNEWMVLNGYAVSYGGGTKVRPISWMRYHRYGEL